MLLVQQIINGVMLGSVYVTVAVAFTLTIGVLNFLNFTIPTLFMMAGMMAWAFTKWGLFGMGPPVPWVIAPVLAIVMTIIVSLIVERFTFRFLKTKYGDSTEHAIPLVSSLGFLLIIENLIRIAYGTEAQRVAGAGGSDLTINIGGLFLRVPQIISLIVVLVIVYGLNWILKHSRIGRGLRAIAENPDAANILGVQANKLVPVIFMLTGLLCGLAGILFAVNYGEVSPHMGEDIGSKAIAGMVVGGLGSIWGAVLGGLIIGLTEMLTIHFFGADTVQVAVWGLLLLTLFVRPQGLFGHHSIGKGKL